MVRHLLLTLLSSVLLGACVDANEPFDGGLIDGPADRTAISRAGLLNARFLPPMDIAIRIDRDESNIQRAMQLRAAFDLEGFVAHPKDFWINDQVQTYLPRQRESFTGGIYEAIDTTLWPANDSMKFAYRDLAGEDFSVTVPIARPLNIDAVNIIDTIDDTRDLVIRYSSFNTSDSCKWRFYSLGDSVSSLFTVSGSAKDRGYVTIPASALEDMKDSSAAWVELSRFALERVQTPQGHQMVVESHMSEIKRYYFRRKE